MKGIEQRHTVLELIALSRQRRNLMLTLFEQTRILSPSQQATRPGHADCPQ